MPAQKRWKKMGFISNKRLYRAIYGCLGISVNQFFRLWTGVERARPDCFMPTADMQQDKTFMLGGNVLDITPLHYYDFFDVICCLHYYPQYYGFSLAGSGYTCTLNYANKGIW